MAIADYLEPAVKDFADQATATYSVPIDTGELLLVASNILLVKTHYKHKQLGPCTTRCRFLSHHIYSSYRSTSFRSRTTAAQTLGQAGQTMGGLGAYQTAAGNIAAGAAGMTGPQAYQPFMSPYQTQVIDATLAEYDKQGSSWRTSKLEMQAVALVW